MNSQKVIDIIGFIFLWIAVALVIAVIVNVILYGFPWATQTTAKLMESIASKR